MAFASFCACRLEVFSLTPIAPRSVAILSNFALAASLATEPRLSEAFLTDVLTPVNFCPASPAAWAATSRPVPAFFPKRRHRQAPARRPRRAVPSRRAPSGSSGGKRRRRQGRGPLPAYRPRGLQFLPSLYCLSSLSLAFVASFRFFGIGGQKGRIHAADRQNFIWREGGGREPCPCFNVRP